MTKTNATSNINKVFFVFSDYMKMSYYVVQRATGKDRRRCRGQGRFACDNCDRRYHQMKNLRRHVTNECGKQPTHQCSYCPYKATYKSYLQVHMMKHAKHGFVPRMAISKHQDS
ncbi:LOLA1 protein, partial [Pseudoatta argentina]